MAELEGACLAAGWRRILRAPEVIFLDGRRGLDPALVRRENSHRIFVTEQPEMALAALASGMADDVLLLGDPMAVAIRLAVAARAVDAHRRAISLISQARRRASVDPLTGLGNRHCLTIDLADLLRRVRGGAPASLLMIDVDHFKSFNDRYGHLAGDIALEQVAEAIVGELRDATDGAYRYGGEEFVVLLTRAGESDSRRVAERIRAAVAGRAIRHVDSAEGRVTVSIGLASLAAGSTSTANDAIAGADAAVYEAKRAGRNRIRIGAARAGAPVGE